MLIEDARAAGEEMQEPFLRQRPIAVVEDCCAVFDWIGPRLADYRPGGDQILSGSSAGGISALNTLFLAGHLRLPPPPVRSLFVSSAGFTYP